MVDEDVDSLLRHVGPPTPRGARSAHIRRCPDRLHQTECWLDDNADGLGPLVYLRAPAHHPEVEGRRMRRRLAPERREPLLTDMVRRGPARKSATPQKNRSADCPTGASLLRCHGACGLQQFLQHGHVGMWVSLARHRIVITRSPKGCTGRLLGPPLNASSLSTCSGEILFGSRMTYQSTGSSHGGVVFEPSYR